MAPAGDATTGMDQIEIFYKKAADKSLPPAVQAAWKALADGLFGFNQDDTETAIRNSNEALNGFRSAGHAEGIDDSILLIARAQTSVGKRKEADKLLRERLVAAQESGNKASEGKALLGLAEVNSDGRGTKRREEAAVAAKSALKIFQSQQDPRLEASALLVLAHIAIKSKATDPEKRAASAISDAKEAIKLCKTVQDKRTEAACQHALASAQDLIEKHLECMFAAEAALDLYLELKDPYAEAFELLCMAQWSENYSCYEIAIGQVEDALEILHSAEKPSTSLELKALSILTRIQQARGDNAGIVDIIEESLKRFQQTDNRAAEAAAMDMLLQGHCERGNYDQALQTAEKARGIFANLNDEASEANVSVIICGLHLKLSRYDEAIELGRSVLAQVKAKGTLKQKTDLMVTLCQAYMERSEFSDALELCNDMQAHFAASGNIEGEAEALVSSGSLYLAQTDFESAKNAASRAQQILADAGNTVGEGRALRLLAEVFSKTAQHKAAIRAGERSRALLKGEESASDEAAMLFLVAQEAVQLAVEEGARVGTDRAPKRPARDALDKAERYGKTAVKLCRDNADGEKILDTLGSTLCTMSQIQMLKGNAMQAVGEAKEALSVFEKTNHVRNQGSAYLLLADAYRAQEKWKDSQNAALSAIRQFKSCDPPDETGEASAQQIINAIKKHLAPAPQMAQQRTGQFMGSGLSPLQLQMMGGDMDDEVADTGGAAVTRTYERKGPALDVANLDAKLVQAKIMEVALALTGVDEEDLEADTPLMEAGITSSAAIGLRDELTKELPGVNLPVTLVFDYPSPAAMVEMIMDSM